MKTEIRKIFAENIHRLRTSSGMSQVDLADKLGMAKQNMNALEKGRKAVTEKTIVKLSEALGCRPSDLLSESKPGQYEEITGLILSEISKMDKPKKARLFADAVAINGGE